MSWRRGFLRLWLVLSVLWIGAVGVGGFGEATRQAAIDRCFELEHGAGRNPFFCIPGPEEVANLPAGTFTATASRLVKANWPLAIAPPVATILAGFVIAWVVAGFRHRGRRTDRLYAVL